MKQYIKAYMAVVNEFIDKELAGASSDRIREVLSEFEVKIVYFQHERLIHLIVTVLFAILEIMSIFMSMICPSLSVALFCCLFLVLLVPYVMHYYFLENSVQQMYHMRDDIIAFLDEDLKEIGLTDSGAKKG